MSLGSKAKAQAVAVGVVSLNFSNIKLILLDVLYVPSLRRNLISVSSLVNQGYSVNFNTEVVIKRNGSFICSSNVINDLNLLTPTMYEMDDAEIEIK